MKQILRLNIFIFHKKFGSWTGLHREYILEHCIKKLYQKFCIKKKTTDLVFFLGLMSISNLAFCYSLDSDSLFPPQSGGGDNIRIIINEYGIAPYPDMDYQSLFSKYSSLGKQCAEDDDDSYF